MVHIPAVGVQRIAQVPARSHVLHGLVGPFPASGTYRTGTGFLGQLQQNGFRTAGRDGDACLPGRVNGIGSYGEGYLQRVILKDAVLEGNPVRRGGNLHPGTERRLDGHFIGAAFRCRRKGCGGKRNGGGRKRLHRIVRTASGQGNQGNEDKQPVLFHKD